MTMLVNGKQGFDPFHAECQHFTPKAHKKAYKRSAKRAENRNWKREVARAY